MKAGYRKRAPKAERLMDGGKAGGYSLSTLDRLDRATADEAPTVVRCMHCPDWKYEGTAAECRGALSEHRRHHQEHEFGPDPTLGGTEERRARVVELRAAGRSLRAIAAELGVSVRTVEKDIAKVSTGRHLPEIVMGRDGRRHPARRASADSPSCAA